MDRKARYDELKKLGKQIIQKKAANGGELSAEDAAALSAYKTEMDKLVDQMAQLSADQQYVDAFSAVGGSGSGDEDGTGAKMSGAVIRNLSHRLAAKSAGVQARGGSEAEQSIGGRSVGTKAALSLSNASDVLVQGLVADPQTPTSLLEVVPVKQIDQPTTRYLRQTSRTMNAAPVAAGGLKPTSSVGIESVDVNLETIATLSDPVDKYSLMDVPTLEQFLSGELSYGVALSLEDQLINGTGTRPSLTGIVGTSGVQTLAAGTDIASTARSAITKLESLGYVPSAIVLDPVSWETVETSVTSGSGEYVFTSSPVDRAARTLWGVPVVVSTALPAGKALVLSADSVNLFTDGRMDLEWSSAVEDDWSRNRLRARLEGRFAVAVTRPQGIVLATLPTSGE